MFEVFFMTKKEKIDWLEFNTYSDWCDFDRLGETHLKDGSKVEILWPNKKVTKHTLKVRKSSYEVSDMGSPYTVPVTTAYIKTKYNGTENTVKVTSIKGRFV